MSVVICHPHNSASQLIGNHALANQYNIKIYMPTETDRKYGEHIYNDLGIMAARSGDNTVEIADGPDFSDPEIEVVFYPNLGELFSST